jgi:hypothetical protein
MSEDPPPPAEEFERVSGFERVSSVKFPYEIEKSTGRNTRQFLADFEAILSQDPKETDEGRCSKLAVSVASAFKSMIRGWSEFSAGDWVGLKARMLRDFVHEEEDKYFEADLKRLTERRRKGKGWGEKNLSMKGPTSYNDIKAYHMEFVQISSYLKVRMDINESEESSYFLRGMGKTLQ